MTHEQIISIAPEGTTHYLASGFGLHFYVKQKPNTTSLFYDLTNDVWVEQGAGIGPNCTPVASGRREDLRCPHCAFNLKKIGNLESLLAGKMQELYDEAVPTSKQCAELVEVLDGVTTALEEWVAIQDNDDDRPGDTAAIRKARTAIAKYKENQ